MTHHRKMNEHHVLTLVINGCHVLMLGASMFMMNEWHCHIIGMYD